MKLLSSKYKNLQLIGEGEFGKVYRALNSETGVKVALKELDRKRQTIKMFLRELDFLVSLKHPNIVACQGLEYSETGRYLVMDYCNAGTLRTVLESEVEIDLVERLKLIEDILLGLNYIHDRGIIHCDIKPENILLSKVDHNFVAYIADFGIARSVQDRQQDTGSPAYMAPERFYGQSSPRSDLYAVGVLLFELVVGERPFYGIPKEISYAHFNQRIDIPSNVALLLRSVILKALEKLPQRRFNSAQEMLKALKMAKEIINLENKSSVPLSH